MRTKLILLLLGIVMAGCQSEKPAIQKPAVKSPQKVEVTISHETLNANLLDAAEKGDTAKVQEWLQAGADIDALNSDGWTALIFAAKAGNQSMVEALVRKGADVNRRSSTKTGSTVLSFATGGNNLAVIDYLLANGADINGKSRNGTTALQYACFDGNTNIAARLISKGADINLPGQLDNLGHSWTPLMTAAASTNLGLIKLLLNRGARLEQTNNHGDTALMEVAKKDVPDSVNLLIESGANVNAKGPFGHTAMHYAAYNGRLENVRLLLAAGADPFARATDSENPDDQKDPMKSYIPSSLAMWQEHPDVVELIHAAVDKIRASQKPPAQSQ